jgi:hypothetical protein
MGRGRYGEPRSRAPELGLLVEQEDNDNRVQFGRCSRDHLAGGQRTGDRQHASASGHER